MTSLLNLKPISDAILDDSYKGIPGGTKPFPLRRIGEYRWNVLAGDLNFPAAILKDRVIRDNSAWMREFLANTGSLIAPHGKTTMAPQLFAMQLADGAWGITAATATQVRTLHRFGVRRILLANQLVGRANIRSVTDLLKSDPGLDFYCLVDSIAGLTDLKNQVARANIGRPLKVLVEVGAIGGRTGARDDNDLLDLARRVRDAEPTLVLAGIEAFEGVFKPVSEEERQNADRLLQRTTQLARKCSEENLFGNGPIVLSAGGSSYFDRVAEELSSVRLSQRVLRVLRCGCYLTHDNGFFHRSFQQIAERLQNRTPVTRQLTAALEVCAYIQSVPEAGLAIAGLGKRDISYDMDMPVPQWRFRPGTDKAPQPVHGTEVRALDDQHAYVSLGPDSDLQIGDIVGFGLSHPCTTFDKWSLVFVVDDNYQVIDAIRTFF